MLAAIATAKTAVKKGGVAPTAWLKETGRYLSVEENQVVPLSSTPPVSGSSTSEECSTRFGYSIQESGSQSRTVHPWKHMRENVDPYSRVLSFVFWDGDPNQGIEEERWKLIGQYIAFDGGVVTAEELAPYLDLALVLACTQGSKLQKKPAGAAIDVHLIDISIDAFYIILGLSFWEHIGVYGLKALSSLGLKACVWVPKLEDIVKCLGFIVDENFSSLMLHPEFCEELKAIDGVVSSLAFEAIFSYSMENVIEKLRAGEMQS